MVKSLTSKRLLSFYAPNVLNGFLIALGKPKALGKIARLIPLVIPLL